MTLINSIADKIFNRGASDETEHLLAFKKHYEEHKNFVRKIVYWNSRLDNIDDIVQECFLKAWKNFGKFDQRSSFKTWIYKIAINATYDELRKQRSSTEFNESFHSKSSHSNIDIEHRDIISKALKTLNRNQREVFILFFKLNYKQEEISETLKIPLGTVKSRLTKAKEEFKKAYLKIGGKNE